jgi:hypothetical protein
MSTYEQYPRAEFLAWATSHQEIFVDNMVALGVSAGQNAAFAGAISQATDALAALTAARNAAKAATLTSNQKFADLNTAAADIVRTIRYTAENTNNPGLYALAEIPAPADPSVVPPPTQPGDVTVQLASEGTLTLRWKSTGSGGGFYMVKRRIGGNPSTPFTNLGGSGNKEFVDATLPLGTTSVTYIITPQRGSTIGTPSEQVTVQFGVGSGPTITGATLTMAA